MDVEFVTQTASRINRTKCRLESSVIALTLDVDRKSNHGKYAENVLTIFLD